MIHKNSEKGQAIILIVFAIVGLIGLTGLTVDGGLVYSDRRQAQNAADSAALAAALAKSRNENITTAAQNVATTNGYNNNGTTNIVTVTIASSPAGVCPPLAINNQDITVEITSFVDTTFSTVVGIQQVSNTVTATTRACDTYIAPIFGGNAIVGLNPNTNGCAFDKGNSNAANWTVTGGGIFSNGCAYSNNSNSVTLDDDKCVTAVGTASIFTCSQAGAMINYPAEVLAIMPPDPCDGTPGDVGLPQPAPNGDSVYITDGVYCITNFDAYDKKDIILDNATLYVTDTVFNLKFAGGGGFSGTPTETGTYSSYYMIIAYDPTPCTAFNDNDAQVIQYRGNGAGALYGTILAPSACIDFRGNSNGSAVHSQIIGYMVSSNGNASVSVDYQANENRQQSVNPTIELIK